MARSAANAATRPLTHRQLSKRERERRQQRILVLGVGGVILLIVTILAAGIYRESIAKFQEPIASVDDRTFTVGDYIEYMRYRDYLLDLQARTLASLGGQAQLQQLNFQRSIMSMQAIEDMIETEVLNRAATLLGIAVPPEEVEAELRERFVAPAKEGETLEEGKRDQEFQTNLDRTIAQSGLSREQIRAIILNDVLRKRVEQKIHADVPLTADQVQVRAIVLDDEEAAKSALARVQGGEDFAAVAREISTDATSKDKDGDLGWMVQGARDPELETAAFGLPLGSMTAEPVNVLGKWYILRAEGQELREVAESDLATLRSKAFRNFLEGKKQEFQVSRYITSEKQLWAMDQVNKARDRRLKKAS